MCHVRKNSSKPLKIFTYFLLDFILLSSFIYLYCVLFIYINKCGTDFQFFFSTNARSSGYSLRRGLIFKNKTAYLRVPGLLKKHV
jgi:hypothetical protein